MTLDEAIEKANALTNTLQSIAEELKNTKYVEDVWNVMEYVELDKLGFDAQSLAEFLEKVKITIDDFEVKYKKVINNE